MLGSGLRYQLYVGRAKGFFRAQYFHSTPLQVKTFRTRCLYLFLCQSLFAPSPPVPFLSGWVLVSISKLFTELLWMTLPGCYPSQCCHGYLHVRLRLFQFTQAPSPHPSIGDGLNRNVKYGSPCQYGSLGIFNQQLISVFTLGLYGWSIQKRRTRLRWKMSSCLVCRFLIFLKMHHKGHASEKFVHCSATLNEEIWSFAKDMNLSTKVIFHGPRLCGFVMWVIVITNSRPLYRKCRGGELF